MILIIGIKTYRNIIIFLLPNLDLVLVMVDAVHSFNDYHNYDHTYNQHTNPLIL